MVVQFSIFETCKAWHWVISTNVPPTMIVLHEKARFVWTYDKTRHTIVELYPARIIRNVAERKKRGHMQSRVVKRGRRDCDERSLQPIRLEIPLVLINRMSVQLDLQFPYRVYALYSERRKYVLQKQTQLYLTRSFKKILKSRKRLQLSKNSSITKLSYKFFMLTILY